MWDALAAMAVLLALETQLRIGSGPLGPGEFLLSLWLAPVIICFLIRMPHEAPQPFWDILRFWFAMAAALSLGVVASIVRDVPVDWSLVVHDIVAYSLLAFLTSALTVMPEGQARLRGMLRNIVLLGAGLLLLQLANAQGLFALGGVDPWYWDRMRGWADNPNQFALLCLLIGFLSVALAERARSTVEQLSAATCAGLALGTGLLAKSNAFTAVIVASLLFFGLAKIGRAFVRAEKQGLPAASLGLAIIALAGWSACIALSVTDLRIDAGHATSSMARDGDANAEDAALRVHLWGQAIKVGTDFLALGLGPGPHLEIPQSILAGRRDDNGPINLQHPKPGIAPNFEAHNTVLELFVQGGLLGVVAFLSIVALGVYRSWKARRDGMAALFLAVLLFGSFHVVFRHPIVWFAICLALVERPLPLTSAHSIIRTRPSTTSGLRVRQFSRQPHRDRRSRKAHGGPRHGHELGGSRPSGSAFAGFASQLRPHPRNATFEKSPCVDRNLYLGGDRYIFDCELGP